MLLMKFKISQQKLIADCKPHLRAAKVVQVSDPRNDKSRENERYSFSFWQFCRRLSPYVDLYIFILEGRYPHERNY